MALFEPIKVGRSQLQHRVVMSPLTRFRADADHVQIQPLVSEYYGQRASVTGTLIVSEATIISPRAGGYPNVPHVHTEAQIASWKKVTDAIHEKGSFAYMQLWALGRAADKTVIEKDGYKFVSSSPTPMQDGAPTPEALTEEEIQQYIAEYAQAAKNAIAAGFDGVEIHGANGYLIDQFTQDTCNKRTDQWGGSVENRCRFGIEVTKAVVDAVGADRTGIRLSPWSTFQGMRMEDPRPTFTYLSEQLKSLGLAYVHVVESRIAGNADIESSDPLDFIIDVFGASTPVILAGGYKPDSAEKSAKAHPNALIGFGRYFISNPDLPFKLKKGIELTPYNRDTFYKAQSPEGYTDYPFSAEFKASL